MTAVAAWTTALLLAVGLPAPQGPTDVIRGSNVRVSRILRPGHRVTRADRDQVNRILEEVTDFDAVSRNVLRGRWDTMPAGERAAFAAAFARLVSATAIAKMGRYRADRFEYLEQAVEGERALVKTKAFYRGRGVSLDYEMARSAAGWRIVNYALNGVDNGASYRRQFDTLLRKESVAALIARLRQKTDELEADDAR